ncbi:aldehyde dehydrogenase (NAD+) [Strigomonas culicis]|uniref:Aldehyde dehydrogenase n=1 Tax=Strigomonas culicis TaxID=28005 RepID=S9VS62_9TRYP|nr:aldehyde dehydrogenase (NAD+) [Strigomonas culicis]|eukprot:EPY26060.1 aldehyde dehydrogenase (NAD+) [Strigomonas culicis]
MLQPAESPCTPIGEIPAIVEKCKQTFRDVHRPLHATDTTTAASQRDAAAQELRRRRALLMAVGRMVEEGEAELLAAVEADLGRKGDETRFMEIGVILQEVRYLMGHLAKFTADEAPALEGFMKLFSCVVQREPLGTVLIIGTWNYPLQMVLMPLVGALAAGNTAVVKPSEGAPATAALLAALLARHLPAGVAGVVCGGVPETTALLAERFDHILYTGSGGVARVVMAAAARHLTPVTLELGGKSPVVVDASVRASVETVARRVLWGKYVNAGQTCVAPDYVLVQRGVLAAFVAACGAARAAMMGGAGGAGVLADPHYTRIVNARHFARLRALLAGGRVVVGGEVDEARLAIAPTVLDEVDLTHPLMTDEIFGPLLPLVPYDTLADALRFINEREKPLALYVFTESSVVKERFKRETSSGAMVVNDVLLHVAVTGAPSGGVGQNGMGQYHGKYSVDTFSHKRTVLKVSLSDVGEGTQAIRYPPYGKARDGYNEHDAEKKQFSCASLLSFFHGK